MISLPLGGGGQGGQNYTKVKTDRDPCLVIDTEILEIVMNHGSDDRSCLVQVHFWPLCRYLNMCRSGLDSRCTYLYQEGDGSCTRTEGHGVNREKDIWWTRSRRRRTGFLPGARRTLDKRIVSSSPHTVPALNL